MALPQDLLLTTCDVYRPFGAGSATLTNVPCRLVADFARGRMAAGAIPEWSHYAEFDAGVDIRDGCTRTAGAYVPTYADGDELRSPSGGSTRYVVVWVEKVDPATSREFKRAYLLRHTA